MLGSGNARGGFLPGIEAVATAADKIRADIVSPYEDGFAREPFPAGGASTWNGRGPAETIDPALISPPARRQAPRGRFAPNKACVFRSFAGATA